MSEFDPKEKCWNKPECRRSGYCVFSCEQFDNSPDSYDSEDQEGCGFKFVGFENSLLELARGEGQITFNIG